MRILKYKLDLTEYEQGIYMPAHSKILSFQMQAGFPTIWVKVIDGFEDICHKFRIVPTGEEVNFNDKEVYIGTVQDGRFVWHLFQII